MKSSKTRDDGSYEGNPLLGMWTTFPTLLQCQVGISLIATIISCFTTFHPWNPTSLIYCYFRAQL